MKHPVAWQAAATAKARGTGEELGMPKTLSSESPFGPWTADISIPLHGHAYGHGRGQAAGYAAASASEASRVRAGEGHLDGCMGGVPSCFFGSPVIQRLGQVQPEFRCQAQISARLTEAQGPPFQALNGTRGAASLNL